MTEVCHPPPLGKGGFSDPLGLSASLIVACNHESIFVEFFHGWHKFFFLLPTEGRLGFFLSSFSFFFFILSLKFIRFSLQTILKKISDFDRRETINLPQYWKIIRIKKSKKYIFIQHFYILSMVVVDGEEELMQRFKEPLTSRRLGFNLYFFPER